MHTCIESLEPRIAPAGLVQIGLANGILTLSGDDDSNIVTVAKVDGETRVIGKDGTKVQLEGKSARDRLDFDQGIRTVKVLLNDGDDVFTLNGKFSGNVSVRGGDGNDTLRFGNSRIGGALSLYGEVGADSLSVGTLKVTGAVLATMGEGDDLIVGSNLRGLNTVTFALGAGDNGIEWAGSLDVEVDLNVRAGSGRDVVLVSTSQVNVDGDISVDLGSGVNFSNLTAT